MSTERVKVTGITVSVQGTEYTGASRGGKRVNEVHDGDSRSYRNKLFYTRHRM